MSITDITTTGLRNGAGIIQSDSTRNGKLVGITFRFGYVTRSSISGTSTSTLGIFVNHTAGIILWTLCSFSKRGVSEALQGVGNLSDFRASYGQRSSCVTIFGRTTQSVVEGVNCFMPYVHTEVFGWVGWTAFFYL
jgi:hypothetical protein